MKRVLLVLAFLAALVGGIYFFASALAAAAKDAFAVMSAPSAWGGLALGGVLFASSYIPSAHLWRLLLRWRDIAVSSEHALAFLLRTTPAKYLPGNVAQPIGRVAALSLSGAPLRGALATLVEEAALSLGVAILVGLAVAGLVTTSFQDPISPALDLMLIASTLVVVVVLALLVMSASFQRWAASISPVARLDRVVVIAGGYAFVMFLIGTSVWISSIPVIGVDAEEWALVFSAFLIAWTLGSLVPGAPAGLGVRDAAMVWMLSPHFAETAVLIATVARLTTLLGDGFAFSAGLMLLRKSGARKQE